VEPSESAAFVFGQASALAVPSEAMLWAAGSGLADGLGAAWFRTARRSAALDGFGVGPPPTLTGPSTVGSRTLGRGQGFVLNRRTGTAGEANELGSNTELTRAIHQLTTEIHDRIVTAP
jgi:hypothetical protein